MGNKRGTFKKIIFAGTLLASLLKPVSSEEFQPKQETEISKSLEQKVSNPKVKIIFNYRKEEEKKGIEYSTASASFHLSPHYEYLDVSENFPLSYEDTIEVGEIIKDVKNGNINSYEEFVNNSINLSENQKIVLLAAISDGLYSGGYDLNSYKINIPSQETFFEILQDYLNGDKNPIGACKQIASPTNQLADDIGFESAAVIGRKEDINHVYNILKTENGTSIIDYNYILTANTKNIEKTLEAYQKDINAIVFQHLFFEDNKFKYNLITKDGKNFLDFIDYDGTTESLKKLLTQKDNSDSFSGLIIDINQKDYQTSAEIDYFNIFAKVGQIRGNSLSPIDKMGLLQFGCKGKIPIFDSCYLIPNAGITLSDSPLLGFNGDLSFNTNNEKEFNLALRIAGNISSALPINAGSALFHDFLMEAGISCNFPINDTMSIENYLITQFALYPKNLDTYSFSTQLNEFKTGKILHIDSPHLNFSLDSYLSIKPWEKEFGSKVNLGNEGIGINVGGYITKSDYDFCPNKSGFDIDLILPLNNSEIKFSMSKDRTNYDREIEDNLSLSLQATIKP